MYGISPVVRAAPAVFLFEKTKALQLAYFKKRFDCKGEPGMDTLIEVLRVRNYKVGYQVRTERHAVGDDGDEVIVKFAYTVPGDDYIGDSVWAHRLFRRGIKPEKADPSHNVCSIGFCALQQKWYGWSHRAFCGFGIGDIVKEGHCTASSGWTDEWLQEHPEDDLSLPIGFVAQDSVDAKRMAIAFAESVS